MAGTYARGVFEGAGKYKGIVVAEGNGDVFYVFRGGGKEVFRLFDLPFQNILLGTVPKLTLENTAKIASVDAKLICQCRDGKRLV